MVKIERTTYPSWHVVSLSCSMMVIQDHNSKHHRGSHHHHDAIKVGACKKGLMKITDKLRERKWRKSCVKVYLLICDKYFITFKFQHILHFIIALPNMKRMFSKIFFNSPFANKSFFFKFGIKNYIIRRRCKIARRKESFAKKLDYQLNQHVKMH